MIIGREKEQSELLSLLEKEESQFCAVYGRRRVGKAYLIRETFNYQFCFQHTGIAKGTLRQQLTAFRNSLTAAGLKCSIPKTWIEAFELLKQLVNNAPAGKKVLFIDDLPWMDTPKGNLIGALENFWNGWATVRRDKDIVLIVCGSATSWISKKLMKDKGGLRGRLTNRIRLLPFTLRECELFANGTNLSLGRKDVLELYMILGGIYSITFVFGKMLSAMSVTGQIHSLLHHIIPGKDLLLNGYAFSMFRRSRQPLEFLVFRPTYVHGMHEERENDAERRLI